MNILSSHDHVYVLSGVIRDFLTGDYGGARDFDIVLRHGNFKDFDILRFLRKSERSKNSFGGLKIRHYNEVVDIWRMSDTWGLKKQNLGLTPESLINTVFFNFSAIVYDLNNRKFIFDERFCSFLQTLTMDVVYPETPNVPLCLVNIYHYQKRYGYRVSERMGRWIKAHYHEEYDLETVQLRHFGNILYSNEIIRNYICQVIKKVNMYKIDWDKYLSSERYRSQSEFKKHQEAVNNEEKRNAFESDFGRVAFSSALRRMHDKAQVMPLTTGDSVHTRLTHSIEVMSIAYSLGINLCRDKDFIKMYGKEQAFEYERSIPMILKTAAFVHDIGNPPFGHFGENIIQNYFSEYLKKRIVTDEQALDFIHFDGNAEGFRILTRLQYIGDLSGLNLTYATLAAYSKYPNSGDVNKAYIGTKKHGVFTSESDILEKMAEACNMKTQEGKIKRHPLSFLVEAADSISYNVMDIEDGMTMGWYSFDEMVKQLDYYLKELSTGKTTSVLAILDIDFVKNSIDENDQKRMMCDFRVSAIRYLVNLAIRNFKNNLEDIDKGIYSKELIEDGDLLSKAFQKFAQNNIFPQREIEQIELTGNSVINGLLDILLDCAFNPDKKFRNHLKSVISDTFLKVAQREDDASIKPEAYKYFSKSDVLSYDIEKLSPYSKLRTIVDLISGMTDRYAVSMYQKLSGQRLS
ncbi:MAG: dNTP triphosphohydrolase [Bacteroidales bacterium]|nr:dNTP triphosphohydrolase [Bacteroidales bacterium]